MKTYLENVLYALGATDVEIHSATATFNIRPDLWVVSVRGIPIGVVGVKKTDVPGKPEALGIQMYWASFLIFYATYRTSTEFPLLLEFSPT